MPVAILFSVLGVLLFLFLLYLFLVAPGRVRAVNDPFRGIRLAHRGLHDATRAENSLSAFENAKAHGFGVELDVRFSKEGMLVVCHDATLKRVAGTERRVVDMTVEELRAVDLCGTGEGVPTFAEVLRLIDGAVPILVEIKQEPDEGDVAAATCEMLAGYHGPYLIESFNPKAVGTVKKRLPGISRGLLCCHYTKDPKRRVFLYRMLERFFLNFLCRPDFIAYNFRDADFLPYRLCKGLFRPMTAAWTTRSPEEECEALACGFDTVIFENYLPASATVTEAERKAAENAVREKKTACEK